MLCIIVQVVPEIIVGISFSGGGGGGIHAVCKLGYSYAFKLVSWVCHGGGGVYQDLNSKIWPPKNQKSKIWPPKKSEF